MGIFESNPVFELKHRKEKIMKKLRQESHLGTEGYNDYDLADI